MKPATADIKTESLRAALYAIAESHAGLINPHVVVDAARDPLSPLHAEFEWDDSEAADLYRLAQAGALVRRMRLTIVRSDAATKDVKLMTTRAYQSRQSQRLGAAGGGYEGIEAIMSDENKRGELLAQVVRELGAYRRRYADLHELQQVWDVLDDAKETFDPLVTSSRQSQPSAPSA